MSNNAAIYPTAADQQQAVANNIAKAEHTENGYGRSDRLEHTNGQCTGSLPLPAFGQPMVARMSEIWSQTSLSLRMYTWQSQLSTELYNVHSGNQPFLTVITTNSTLIGDGFQSQLKFPDKTLIVGRRSP